MRLQCQARQCQFVPYHVMLLHPTLHPMLPFFMQQASYLECEMHNRLTSFQTSQLLLESQQSSLGICICYGCVSAANCIRCHASWGGLGSPGAFPGVAVATPDQEVFLALLSSQRRQSPFVERVMNEHLQDGQNQDQALLQPQKRRPCICHRVTC